MQEARGVCTTLQWVSGAIADSHQKKKVRMRRMMKADRTSVRTMPVTVLHAITWKRNVLRAHITMENPKSGRDPDKEVPILEFRRSTSSCPENCVWSIGRHNVSSNH